MTPTELLATLQACQRKGWLRRLDVALARFIHETDASAPPSLIWAAALVSQMEARGHAALDLNALAADAQRTLAWPATCAPEASQLLTLWPQGDVQRHEAWHASASIEREPVDDRGVTPLVEAGGLLYLRRLWRAQRVVARQIQARTTSNLEPVDRERARHVLGRLFESAVPGQAVDWQQVACALALRGRLTLITGGPGTGKTYTAARLLLLLQALNTGSQPLRMALAAPTGKAAARLRQSILRALGDLPTDVSAELQVDRWLPSLGPASTLHALLGAQMGSRQVSRDAAHPLDIDLLLVDEASMIHLELMSQVLAALPAKARLVLLGDRDQLASVEAGSVMADLCATTSKSGSERAVTGYDEATSSWLADLTGSSWPEDLKRPGPPLAQQTVVLTRSRRFEGGIGSLAQAIHRADADDALALLRSPQTSDLAMIHPASRDVSSLVQCALNGREGVMSSYRQFVSMLQKRPDTLDRQSFEAWAASIIQAFDAVRVLCVVREGPWGVGALNRAIERELGRLGLIDLRSEWYEGRPVMVTRNQPQQRIFNGDIGIVLRGSADSSALRCHFLEGDQVHSVPVSRLTDVETAYAMTVHKSQGSEFGHVLMVMPDQDVPMLTRELVYTGITRARQAFTLVAPKPDLLATAIQRQTQRFSGLAALLAQRALHIDTL